MKILNQELPHSHELIESIQSRMSPLRTRWDLKPLIDRLGQAKIVMLGEASHGTREFYEWRSVISMQLLLQYGFKFIAVEGDWPPCFELNRYIRRGEGGSIREVIAHFNRWPTWMWANTEVIQLAEKMRSHNSTTLESNQVSFYGLDVYSLFESIDSVLKQLDKVNPFLARRARAKYACFDPFRRDEMAYAKSLSEFPAGCEKEVIDTLQELLKLRLNGLKDREEALFDAQQNARVIVNAENYYRTMIYGNEDSWNVRDRHMMETLNLLLKHHGEDSKAIVWAHNTHIGDYRATDMLKEGQVNIGGLARQEWGDDNVALVGFGTYEGEVIASHAWDGPIEIMKVHRGKSGSYESAFHEVALAQKQKSFFISLDDEQAQSGPLSQIRGHRAIGVVYNPGFERFGNYVPTSLSHRYNAFIFIDQTSALEPLIQDFEREDIPETWPQGQ